MPHIFSPYSWAGFWSISSIKNKNVLSHQPLKIDLTHEMFFVQIYGIIFYHVLFRDRTVWKGAIAQSNIMMHQERQIFLFFVINYMVKRILCMVLKFYINIHNQLNVIWISSSRPKFKRLSILIIILNFVVLCSMLCLVNHQSGIALKARHCTHW